MFNLRSRQITEWLDSRVTKASGTYRHHLLVENRCRRATAIVELKRIVQEAHEDARRQLCRCVQSNLDPILPGTGPTVGDAYPSILHLNTKKAYFGEIMAGIVAENYASVGPGKWRVPVFLFRLHHLAFDQLEMWRETGLLPQHVPGQPGDDCVAFCRDTRGTIVAALVCEGKCTHGHDSSLIADAHRKLGTQVSRPTSLHQIIGILREQMSDPEAQQWAEALTQLYLKDLKDDYRRCDLASYTCGRRPARRLTWMPVNQPHAEYQGGRDLESVEIHIADVDDLVEELYRQ